MIVLASQSPRRRELMDLTGLSYRIEPADIDETIPEGISPAEAVEYLSRIKAEAVAVPDSGDIFIGADTIVAYSGMILEKPKDDDDAFRMLKMLSGNTHSVFTGVTIIGKGKVKTFSVETSVEFNNVTDDEIKAYVATGEPADKSGSYAIQGLGSFLVKTYKGDVNNVIGLPIERLCSELKEFL
jgi:septum formation protein